MNIKHLPLLFIALMYSLTSCKKEKQSLVSGKWMETKLRLYGDSSNVILYDTTYLNPFTNLDYLQFNSTYTVIASNDHYYYPNYLDYPKDPQQIPPVSSTFNYTVLGSKYVLTPHTTLINPAGFITRDTIIVTGANTLMLRSVSYGHYIGPVKTVADSYYTKQ